METQREISTWSFRDTEKAEPYYSPVERPTLWIPQTGSSLNYDGFFVVVASLKFVTPVLRNGFSR